LLIIYVNKAVIVVINIFLLLVIEWKKKWNKISRFKGCMKHFVTYFTKRINIFLKLVILKLDLSPNWSFQICNFPYPSCRYQLALKYPTPSKVCVEGCLVSTPLPIVSISCCVSFGHFFCFIQWGFKEWCMVVVYKKKEIVFSSLSPSIDDDPFVIVAFIIWTSMWLML